jgi:hypothetical protein
MYSLVSNTNAARIVAIFGCWLQIFSLFGLLGTIFGISKAMHIDNIEIDSMLERYKWLQFSEITSLYASYFVYFGLFLIFISVCVLSFRSKWIFWFLIIYGFILLLSFSYSAIIGLYFIVFSVIYRDQFMSNDKRHQVEGAGNVKKGQQL